MELDRAVFEMKTTSEVGPRKSQKGKWLFYILSTLYTIHSS